MVCSSNDGAVSLMVERYRLLQFVKWIEVAPKAINQILNGTKQKCIDTTNLTQCKRGDRPDIE